MIAVGMYLLATNIRPPLNNDVIVAESSFKRPGFSGSILPPGCEWIGGESVVVRGGPGAAYQRNVIQRRGEVIISIQKPVSRGQDGHIPEWMERDYGRDNLVRVNRFTISCRGLLRRVFASLIR